MSQLRGMSDACQSIHQFPAVAPASRDCATGPFEPQARGSVHRETGGFFGLGESPLLVAIRLVPAYKAHVPQDAGILLSLNRDTLLCPGFLLPSLAERLNASGTVRRSIFLCKSQRAEYCGMQAVLLASYNTTRAILLTTRVGIKTSLETGSIFSVQNWKREKLGRLTAWLRSGNMKSSGKWNRLVKSRVVGRDTVKKRTRKPRHEADHGFAIISPETLGQAWIAKEVELEGPLPRPSCVHR